MSAINKKKIKLFDEETGRVLGSLAQYEYEKKEQAIKNAYLWTKHGEKFVFARMEAIKEVISALSTVQCGYFLVLQTYADYDGILKNTALRKQDKTPMTYQDMMKALKGIYNNDILKQTFSDFIKACLDNNIVIKNNDNSYMLNNKYHFRGEVGEDKKVTKIFNTEVRDMFKCIKPADLGLLYRLIPYIHMQTNTLCFNPYEEDPTKLQKLNQKQLCELLEISRPTFYRILDMEYNGMVVLAEIRKKRTKKSYLVNPWVFYRLEIKPNDSLLGNEVNPYAPDATLRSIFSADSEG